MCTTDAIAAAAVGDSLLGLRFLSGPAPALRIGDCLASFGAKYALNLLGYWRGLSDFAFGFLDGLDFGGCNLGFYFASCRKKIADLLKARNLRIELSDDRFNCHSAKDSSILWISRIGRKEMNIEDQGSSSGNSDGKKDV